MYAQAGGHTDTIIFRDNTLEKLTKESEAKNYELIFSDSADSSLTKLQPFLPKFYLT